MNETAMLQNQINKWYSKEDGIPAVCRLTYAGKYIIVKGKTLSGSLYFISLGWTWYNEKSNRKDVLYMHFYNHVIANPGKRFYVKLLYKTEDAYQLLKFEQNELDKAMHDQNCLNNQVEAYIPKLSADGTTYGWISVNSVMNFKKYLNSPARKALVKQYKEKLQPKPAKSA